MPPQYSAFLSSSAGIGGQADAAAALPLVPIGKFAHHNVAIDDAAGRDRRLKAWFLQAVARDVLGSSWRGLHNCCRARIAGHGTVDVYRSVLGDRSTFYGGLQRCGSLWLCAVCGRKIVEYRRGEIERGLAGLCGSGGAAAFMTLTVRHGPADDYQQLMDRVASALRYLQNSKTWTALKYEGYIGSIRAFETTWGPLQGWHPHYHILLCFAFELPSDLQSRLRPAWASALARAGLSASGDRGLVLDQTAGAIGDYLAKWGCEPAGKAWGPEDELARAAVKAARSGTRFSPFELLSEFAGTGDATYRDRFREYAAVSKGRSQLQWSRGLRDLLLGGEVEKSDAELVEGVDEEAALLGRLTFHDWQLVLWAGKRGQLLEAARTSWADVEAFLGALALAYGRVKGRV